MNRSERATLEKDFRAAEGNLALARERAQGVAAKVEARIADLRDDTASLRTDDRLSNLVASEDAAKAALDDATAKRDGVLKQLAGNPIATVINGHDGIAGETRGVPIGFNKEMLREARSHLLGENPSPIRLGPALGPDGIQAADSSDWAQGAITSYDLTYLWPPLAEIPSVARLFRADMIDVKSREYFRFSAAADQAAVTAENATKPLSDPQTEAVTVTPQVVAHYGVFSRQLLLNAGNFLDQYIGEYVRGLNLAVDQGLVSGSGSGELHGISTASGIGTYWRNSTNSELRADAILAGITNVRTNAFVEPTHLIIHPTDLETVRKERPGTGEPYNYAPFAQLDASGVPRNLWGLQVVPTTSATQGEAIVIDPNTFGLLTVRLPVIAEVDPYSLFSSNRYQLRCETMLDLAVIRAAAACLVSDL